MLARSRSSTCIGSSTCAETPRSARLEQRALAAEAAEQPLDPRRARLRRAGWRCRRRSRPPALRRARSAASKSSGTTTTGSPKRRAAQLRLEVGRRRLAPCRSGARGSCAASARASSAGDVDLALLGARLERGDQAEIASSTSGPISTDETSTVSERAPVAQRVDAAPCAARPGRAAIAPRSSRAASRAGALGRRTRACTNASSKSRSPVRASSSRDRAGRDRAAVRDDDDAVAEPLDLLHDVGREDDALARRPRACAASAGSRAARASPARRGRWSARRARCSAGSWTSARASAVFIRSPWLKPSVRRSSSAVMSSMRARSCGARIGGVARHAVQRAVVDDVLARGQARIEAARIGQHAHARQHLARPRDDVDAVDRASCRRRARSAPASMRSVVVLPAPFGPSRPVMRPSGASKPTSRRRAHARAPRRGRAARAAARPPSRGTAKRLGEPRDLDHRATRAATQRRRRSAETPAAAAPRAAQPASTAERPASSAGVDEAEHDVAHAADAEHAVAGVRRRRRGAPSARARQRRARRGAAASPDRAPPLSSSTGAGSPADRVERRRHVAARPAGARRVA